MSEMTTGGAPPAQAPQAGPTGSVDPAGPLLPTLSCGRCRQQVLAGIVRCPACGGSTRTAQAAALAALAAAAGLLALAVYGHEAMTTEAKVLRPAFAALTGLLGLWAAWSVFMGRRAGWIGLHLVWAIQLVVPFLYAVLVHRGVIQALVRDPKDFALVKVPILIGLVLAWTPAARAYCSAPSNLMTMLRREIGAYLHYPLAYVILFGFLLIVGLFFNDSIQARSQGELVEFSIEDWMRTLFGLIFSLMIFCAPLLTMRLVAEEKKTGTIEVLMTAPVTDLQVVLAKFFAILLFFGLLMAPTLVYTALLVAWSVKTPDCGLILGGYLDLLFTSAAYLSMGLFFSSLTRNQVVAAVVTFAAFLIVSFLPMFLIRSNPKPWIGAVADHANLMRYHELFSRGVVHSSAVVFDVSLTVFFLFLTVRALESRRWA
jgi:ABC-2 type transport system permease protein